MTIRTYDSPAAFKEALEHRLRARTPKGTIVDRTRQLLVFDRLLARIVEVFGDSATVKGGVALELRLARARTTKDVDLRFMGSSNDSLVAEDVLGFAGIAPPTLRVYPLETHVAEKLHAYTLPRKRPNSRIKDLPDLGLLAGVRSIDVMRLRSSLEQTFGFRATHEIPPTLPPPPAGWQVPYAVLARDDQLVWPTLQDVFTAARAFLDPVLARKPGLTWDPGSWTWSAQT